MKLLFLPPQTEFLQPDVLHPGRLFFEDGRELPFFSRFLIEGSPVSVSVEDIRSGKMPKYVSTKLYLEIDNPDVEIIKEAPTQIKP